MLGLMLMLMLMLKVVGLHPGRTLVSLSWVVDGSFPLGIDVCLID